MKSLQESLLDDEDTLLGNTTVMPKVESNEYLYYTQAWYDILRDMKESEKNINLYIDLYLKWMSDWTISLGTYNLEEINDFFKSKSKDKLYHYVNLYIEEQSEWTKNNATNLINKIRPKLISKDKVVSWLFHIYDGIFYKIYRSKLFSREPKTKEYYKYIKYVLINKGMKFK